MAHSVRCAAFRWSLGGAQVLRIIRSDIASEGSTTDRRGEDDNLQYRVNGQVG